MTEHSSRSITSLLVEAYARALREYFHLHSRWIRASASLGGMIPNSLLVVSAQRLGRLDLILRHLEDENCRADASKDNGDYSILASDLLSAHSELWIGQAYAVLQSIISRKISTSDELREIHRNLKLIRVSLEKYEIPNDRNLAGTLILSTSPKAEEEQKLHSYDSKDPKRSYIMPAGISPRGSLCWMVTDAKSLTGRWLERRYLSDCLLNCLAPEIDPIADVAV